MKLFYKLNWKRIQMRKRVSISSLNGILKQSIRFCLANKIVFSNILQKYSIDWIVSSLPGIGYVINRGSEFVSTIPTVGIIILADSLMAG
ncbi:hypothetical protein QR98_0068030 [Sarcoptes scabiei]|uniref:Uncharacterized protein n=1 Tax=Sarcoptes scabiei TaxID=52283 RepID=A0A132ABJ3_SARSC|nr:hypothetical protein QR98_0068030 [Sarcoptes scabiei]